MPTIIGIDLGVRTAHVSTPRHCFTIGLKPKAGSRCEEIQCIYDGIEDRFGADTYAFVEEPVVAGARNLRTSLRIAQISGAVLSAINGELVPVSTWKKAIVGKGNAKKEEVKAWLKTQPEYDMAFSSQDWIDATCLRLYGQSHKW